MPAQPSFIEVIDSPRICSCRRSPLLGTSVSPVFERRVICLLHLLRVLSQSADCVVV
jgi:hypothetical protein